MGDVSFTNVEIGEERRLVRGYITKQLTETVAVLRDGTRNVRKVIYGYGIPVQFQV